LPHLLSGAINPSKIEEIFFFSDSGRDGSWVVIHSGNYTGSEDSFPRRSIPLTQLRRLRHLRRKAPYQGGCATEWPEVQKMAFTD
jgi:hypothetical protein